MADPEVCFLVNGDSTGIISLSVSHSHGTSTAIATVEYLATGLSLGDAITIQVGYDTVYTQIFTGYVKSVEHTIPEDTYVVTANDVLIRAVDFFIVSSNPDEPLTFSNISGEALVTQLLALAGLTSVDVGTTGFTFGVSNAFEVNQVSVYDFCKSIADLLAWTLWCDEVGVVHFKNRKPFPMVGGEPQPGWVDDSSSVYSMAEDKTLDFSYSESNSDLRNRIVVYGPSGVQAEASDDSIDPFHWKTAVLADASMIETIGMAQDIADYNLHLLNKISESVSMSVIGDPVILPFNILTIHPDPAGPLYTISIADYYIYSSEHSITKAGYITRVELKR